MSSNDDLHYFYSKEQNMKYITKKLETVVEFFYGES